MIYPLHIADNNNNTTSTSLRTAQTIRLSTTIKTIQTYRTNDEII
jgi:hypothetical protein